MITLREAAAGLLTVVVSAIEAGDWKVDGACDPHVEIIRLKNALGKPDKEWVGLTEDEVTNCFLDSSEKGILIEEAIEAKLKEKNT
jgi:hypothetical protein